MSLFETDIFSTKQNALEVHPSCQHVSIVPFYCSVVFHGMTVPPFVHSPLGAFGLFSVWDNIIQNCYQHSSVGVCINISLISIDKHQE